MKKKKTAIIMAVVMLLSVMAAPEVFATGEANTSSGNNTTGIKPTAPHKVTAKADDHNTVKITWSKVNNAQGYNVYRRAKNEKNYKRIKTITNKNVTKYSNTGLKTGKIYIYRMKSVTASNAKQIESDFSKGDIAKPVPEKVSRVSGKATGRGKIRLAWTSVEGASGYKIYRATSSNGRYKAIKTTRTRRHTDTKLDHNKTYYYKIKAYKTVSGKKVWSAASDQEKVKNTSKYKKIIRVKAYAYTGGGTTASGMRAKVGRIAVDPRVIPLGSKLYVEGYGYCVAADTGGDIKGRVIDVYKNSQAACNRWGVRYPKVYILK